MTNKLICFALAYALVFIARGAITFFFVRWIVRREVKKLDQAVAESFADVGEDMENVIGRVNTLSKWAEGPQVRYIQGGGNA